MKTICIYHSKDLDGYASAAIVKHWHRTHNVYGMPQDVIDFMGYDYGQPIPNTSEYDKVIMCDISLPKEIMADIPLSKLIWIDHHVSAIRDSEMFPYFDSFGIRAEILDDGSCEKIGACELAWKYLFPDQIMPETIKLLSEYDSWRNSDVKRWNEQIMPFQYGMRLVCNSLESFPMDIFNMPDDVFVVETIINGDVVLKYQNQQNENSCKFCAFEIEFEGLRAICLNSGGANSQLFSSVYDESKHDIMIPFVYTGKHWTYSIYSTKSNIDCSVLAKKYGGGGHAAAAGFKTNIFIFNK